MGSTRRFCTAIVGVGAALLLSAPVASAAARFASPGGLGTTCSEATPCGIGTAINNAVENDDVTIEPGTYGPAPAVPNLFDAVKKLTIHGQAGAPRPVIIGATGFAIGLGGAGSSLSDVEIDEPNASSTAVRSFAGFPGATIDRVIAHTFGTESKACETFEPVTITNSVCVADGPLSQALLIEAAKVVASTTLRNDTFEASGGEGANGGQAIRANAREAGHAPIALSNSIAHGANVDLLAVSDGSAGSEAAITADHSNYLTATATPGAAGKASVTPVGSGSNQAAAPKFVNAAADDFHELTGSPTIGAGFNTPINGTLDLDGNPRQFGVAADIGAYQFIPGPTCQALTATTGFGQPTTLQLSCADVLGAALGSYAILAAPAHGTAAVNAASGAVTYTPAPGYSGPDSFTFDATSSHGTGAAATATITVGAGPSIAPAAPRDSQPLLSPQTFAALASGPAVIAKTAKGTTITYTDTEIAKTLFLVRKPSGKGVLVRGKCVAPPRTRKGATHGRRCARFTQLGSFIHNDLAGANRFRFTGRIGRHALKPGAYQLVSTPTNAVGKSGASHVSSFKIVHG